MMVNACSHEGINVMADVVASKAVGLHLNAASLKSSCWEAYGDAEPGHDGPVMPGGREKTEDARWKVGLSISGWPKMGKRQRGAGLSGTIVPRPDNMVRAIIRPVRAITGATAAERALDPCCAGNGTHDREYSASQAAKALGSASAKPELKTSCQT